MIKLILCILIVFSGAVTGVYYSRRLFRRRDTLASFLSLFHKASIMMKYEAADLCKLFHDNAFEFEFHYDEPFDVQWMKLIGRYRPVLKEKDLEVLSDFIKNMGSTDMESDRDISGSTYSHLLEEQLKEAGEEVIGKGRLYQVLPLSAGIVISLLLI